MAVTFTETEIPDVLVVESSVYSDDRGFFSEAHNRDTWAAAGLAEIFVQDNVSCSAKGTLRGMHYQILPHAMGKCIRVLRGAIFDVAVDLREASPTFGNWVGRTLSADNGLALWVPVGFAHGFVALKDQAVVYYKCTDVYTPEAERSLLYSDPAVGIEWPLEPTRIAEKDAAAPPLDKADFNFTFSVHQEV